MPRNIPLEALLKLAQTTGLEPVNIIRIQWVKDGGYFLYADRVIRDQPSILGKLLSLDGLEAVLNIDKSGTTTSVKVKLDDASGEIKGIFNYNDIHNRPVVIYQWFADVDFPIDYKFAIFEGSIASPIEWNEGDRTISFDVITSLEDREVGFIVEDGDFLNVPEILLGHSWPIVFGTVRDMPTVRMDDTPSGTTQVAISIPDPSLRAHIKYIDCQSAIAAGKAMCLAGRAGEMYIKFKQIGEEAYLQRAIQLECQSFQMLSSANEGMARKRTELTNILIQQALEAAYAEEHDIDLIPIINGHNFLQGVEIEIKINNAVFMGSFQGDNFNVTAKRLPDDDKRNNQGKVINPFIIPHTPGTVITSSKCESSEGDWTNDAYWACDPPWHYVICDEGQEPVSKGQPWFAQAGASVSVGDNYPIRYILSIIPGTVVNWLSAYKSVNGFKVITPIPPSYYTVSTITFGTITALIATFNQILSSKDDEFWENEVYATLTSPIGPNVVDILVYLITTYTENAIDSVSFAHVRGLLINYPANFAILDKKNIVELLTEIAWQSRCSIWIADNTFYIKYLPEQGTPIDTITEDDIEQQTLGITTTPTEDLVTKLVGTWKASYAQPKDNRVIGTYNINKYGVKERIYNFYIYNSVELVQKSVTFWLIRLANMWKRVICTAFLTKLKLETMDNVIVDLAHQSHAIVPVVGVMEKATFNSDDYTIPMEIWIPVRIGEMLPYDFAYPHLVDIRLLFPTAADIAGGFVNDIPQSKGASGNLNGRQTTKQGGSRSQSSPSDQFDSTANNNLPPIQTTTIDPYLNSNSAPVQPGNRPTTDYAVTPIPQQVVRIGSTPLGGDSSMFPGFIRDKIDASTYSATIFPNGFGGTPEDLETVVIPQINPDETIPNGTYGLFSKRRITVGDETIDEYYFQPSIYSGVLPDED